MNELFHYIETKIPLDIPVCKSKKLEELMHTDEGYKIYLNLYNAFIIGVFNYIQVNNVSVSKKILKSILKNTFDDNID